jgi:hypothetical protein
MPAWGGSKIKGLKARSINQSWDGPRRNAKCQVVDPDNQPIPKLYSAGELGSFWGWMYNGGGNNAEALCTGRIAVRNILAKK